MEQKLCVFLYSKYSSHCSKLIHELNTCGFDFMMTTGMSTLCIDNKEIRDKLMASNNIEIEGVPWHVHSGSSR